MHGNATRVDEGDGVRLPTSRANPLTRMTRTRRSRTGDGERGIEDGGAADGRAETPKGCPDDAAESVPFGPGLPGGDDHRQAPEPDLPRHSGERRQRKRTPPRGDSPEGEQDRRPERAPHTGRFLLVSRWRRAAATALPGVE